MKVKVLRYKDTKEFLHIRNFGGKHELFTSSLPKLYPITAKMELIEKIFPLDDCNFDNFDNMEFGEFDLIDFGEVGADIRNKLSPSKNLIALLEMYFDKKTDFEQMMGLKKIIEKEMEQTKENIDYIANLL
ncbi:MAG: hypothetical protein DRN27_05845 [Thermoplasmata archaeon]|nr:MAG: hypothetical protein DRN27_05845 [Thermoplasmata archaeon]